MGKQGAGGNDFLARWDEFDRVVRNVVAAMGGSFSAEHGIGRLKATLDPNGIMNPGKVV